MRLIDAWNRRVDNGHSWHYCPNCGAKMDEVSEDV